MDFSDEELRKIPRNEDNTKVNLEQKDASSSERDKPSISSVLRRSPDACAICLGAVEHTSFVDTCLHSFCFTCIQEWSKVKAVCPKCNQKFTSILHNVRSDDDYDQYHIPPKNGSTNRSLVYNPSSKEFRRNVYRRGLWVRQFNFPRYRISSPDFYLQNPGCTHRLIRWLRRELLALLSDNEDEADRVSKLIVKLVNKYDIRSVEFSNKIRPYLRERTSHFIHEFFNYAISPLHDMRTYDASAKYVDARLISERNANDRSLPAGSGATGGEGTSQSTSTFDASISSLSNAPARETVSSGSHRSRFSRSDRSSNVRKLSLPTSSHSLQDACHRNTSSSRNLDHSFFSGPSTSGLQTSADHFGRINRKRSLVEHPASDSSSSEDDCVFLRAVKHRVLPKTEIINLASSSEDEDNINDNDSQNNRVTNQVVKTGVSSCKRREFTQSTSDRSIKKMRRDRKNSVSPSKESETCANSVLRGTFPADEKWRILKRKDFPEIAKRSKQGKHHRERTASLSYKSEFPRDSAESSPTIQDQVTLCPPETTIVTTTTENYEQSSLRKCVASHDDSLDHNVRNSSVSHCTSSYFSDTSRSRNTFKPERTRGTNESLSSELHRDCDSVISPESSSSQTHTSLDEERNQRHGFCKEEPYFSRMAALQRKHCASNHHLSEIYRECSSFTPLASPSHESLDEERSKRDKCPDTWQDDTSSSDEEWKTKVTLRSVVFRVNFDEQQNTRSNSSSHNKRHKHKRKQSKKHKRHSHSQSDKKYRRHSHSSRE